jgi:sulfane dehydrogenase subunit SoxC
MKNRNGDALPTTQPSRGRRAFLAQAAAVSGALAVGAVREAQAAETNPLGIAPWQTVPGTPAGGYGQPSPFEKSVLRHLLKPYGDRAPGTGPTFTPIEALEGTITPSGLHFVRNHNGVPAIDPAQHRLMIHGLVKRPLIFTMEALLRYPTISRPYFLECAGNSGRALTPQPLQIPAGGLHGLVSCSEWTGIPLSVLLEEAGIDRAATWLLAEGADAAAMSRSIPMEKALDDAMLALYQNGERLRPEQGYPLRLVLPGWEGNMSVKWLRRLKLTDGPTHTKDETSKYTDPLPNGKALQFTYEMGVKSVITRPSSGMTVPQSGLHEISGIAWSGAGRIVRVEVSTDGGASWRAASLHGEQFPKSLVRFRLPWEWDGVSTIVQSRATDEKGRVQPPRKAFLTQFAPDIRFHNNSIVSWAVNSDGSVKNVYV